MKKLSLYTASLVALGLGFTACDQLHNDFRLEPPTAYTLETPSDIDQLISFGVYGSNVNNQWEVTTAYPYNINTQINVQMQVAKSESDFLVWENLVSDNGGDENGEYTDADGLPYATFVNATYTTTSFTVPGADLCDAINLLYGFETEEEASAAPVQVAYRIHIWVPNVLYSSIFSNVVTLPQVKTYIPIRDPRSLYLIGEPNNWDLAGNEKIMAAVETEGGSNIYKGTFVIQAGKFTFRFYSELGDNWNANSYGAGAGYTDAEDTNYDIEFTDDTYFGKVYDGKGKWNVPGWTGGTIDVTINLNDMSIEIIAHEGEVPTDPEAPEPPTGNALYVVGACQTPGTWNVDESWKWIEETTDGSNIYEGVFEVPAGQFQFRFYSQLTGNWDQYSVGSQNADENVIIEFTDGSYSGPVVAYDPAADLLGKGNWNYPEWAGGWIKVTVNLNDLTIVMAETEKPAEKVNIYVRGVTTWDPVAEWQFVTTDQDNVFALYGVTIGANVQFKIADKDWGACNFGLETEGATIQLNQEVSLIYGGDSKNFCLAQDFTGDVFITYDEAAETMSVIFKTNS